MGARRRKGKKQEQGVGGGGVKESTCFFVKELFIFL